jgi:hypothetical protein
MKSEGEGDTPERSFRNVGLNWQKTPKGWRPVPPSPVDSDEGLTPFPQRQGADPFDERIASAKKFFKDANDQFQQLTGLSAEGLYEGTPLKSSNPFASPMGGGGGFSLRGGAISPPVSPVTQGDYQAMIDKLRSRGQSRMSADEKRRVAEYMTKMAGGQDLTRGEKSVLTKLFGKTFGQSSSF